jgi:glycine C-acetyltransferase
MPHLYYSKDHPMSQAAAKMTQTPDFYTQLQTQLDGLRQDGLYKEERVITSAQDAEITVNGKRVLNFCANNYLGLANHPKIRDAAKQAIDDHGFGMASVRFICGTQDVHKNLEQRLAKFLGFEDCIVYSSAYSANTGLFDPILGPEDAIISDELNHACIIDGIRLCKAKRYVYKNEDMADLEAKLKEAKAKGANRILIATDGVFSMEGSIAPLQKICDLADQYGALTMVDDSHATGFVGKSGRGTHEYCGVAGRIDIMTGTIGKALGGSTGGYVAGKRVLVDWLRNRSRTYLFSNAIPPVVAAASITAIDLVEQSDALRQKLQENAKQFRAGLTQAGFELFPGDHPIIPVMLGDAKLAGQLASELLAEGIYVIAFSFPVVPQGKARIRTQMSAAHTTEQVERCVAAFVRVGKKLGVI